MSRFARARLHVSISFRASASKERRGEPRLAGAPRDLVIWHVGEIDSGEYTKAESEGPRRRTSKGITGRFNNVKSQQGENVHDAMGEAVEKIGESIVSG